MVSIKLDKFQARAAYSHDQHLLISAPAGSGKTRVLIERVAWLVNKEKVEPSKILVLTFAKKAATEIRERLGQQNLSGVTAKTFHAWAYKLAGSIHTKPFTLIDEVKRQSLFRQILINLLKNQELAHTINQQLEDLNWPRTYLAQELIKVIETLQQFGWSPAAAKLELGSQHSWTFIDLMFSVWQNYNQLLLKNAAYDFPLLINQACEYLSQNHVRRKIEQNKITHLLVDEVQDSNQEELQLLSAITSKKTRVTYIGDFNQAIYAWRGASKFEWLGQSLNLSINYRSDQKVIDLINNFIGQDTQAIRQPRYKPLLIKHARYQDLEVIKKIIGELNRLGYNNNNILVLARAHQPLKQIKFIKKYCPGVRLETVHAVKGLEAPVVILLNCSEDRFGFPLPVRQQTNPVLAKLANYDQPAEEKRLFYVAMTRAQERLIFLSDQQRPSSFTKNLPRRLLKSATMPTS